MRTSSNTRPRNLGAAAGGMLALALIATVADVLGRSSRAMTPERRVVEVAAQEDSLHVWRQARVRGRVLYLFARRISAGEGPLPDRNSYVRHAIREGVVRDVVHVVPESAWSEVSATLARRGSRRRGETYRLRVAGVPLLVTHTGGIPPPDEPVLVNFDRAAFAAPELARIDAFLQQAPSDLVVVGGDSGASMAGRAP